MKVADFILTPKSAIFILPDGTPLTIMSSDARYNEAVRLIKEDRLDDAIDLADKAKAIDKRTEGKFIVIDGVVNIDGQELPSALSSKLLSLVEQGRDTAYLERFWDNLRKNPTESSRRDLFAFLEANNIPITKDGCFIVYKKVREDYWDSHTGRTHMNKPGTTVSMPREDVDPNRDNTCSSGLHVAAWDYARSFSGERLMECKVNPTDVVAVPPDYNQQKMRVCRYQVLRETTTPYQEALYENDAEFNVDQPLVEDVKEILVLNRDSEGRIRIPGSLVRKVLRVGVGRRVGVFAGDDGRLLLRRGKKADKPLANYVAQSDNCVRVSRSVLSQVIPDSEEFESFVVTELDGELEIMPHDD